MRIYIRATLILAIIAGMAACKKSKDFTRDESTPTGVGYAPVSANTLQDVTSNPIKTLATTPGSAGVNPYPAGSTFKTELTYFSQSRVKETTLSQTIGTGTKTLVSTTAYDSAYSVAKSLDTLLVPYTVPLTAGSGTVIRLDYQITNDNALNVIRTVYIKVQ